MGVANVVRLNIYTTDVDLFLANYGRMAERLSAAGVAPPGGLAYDLAAGQSLHTAQAKDLLFLSE